MSDLVPPSRSGYSVPKNLVEFFQSGIYREFYERVSDGEKGLTDLPSGGSINKLAATPVDLLDKLPSKWRARNQHKRGTCTGFCASACVDLLQARATGEKQAFSPEFVYYYLRVETAKYPCKIPDYGRGAALLSVAGRVVENHGICHEETWPYDKNAELSSLMKPDDPAKAEAAAYVFKDAGSKDFGECGEDPAGIEEVPEFVLSSLAAGRPVAIGVPIFAMPKDGTNNWQSIYALKSGIVRSPFEATGNITRDIVSGHAVCIVGYQPAPGAVGGGWFIFRNSWGDAFATHPSRGYGSSPKIPMKGYGAISAHYLRCFTIEYASFELAQPITN